MGKKETEPLYEHLMVEQNRIPAVKAMTWAPPQDRDEIVAAEEESDGVRRSWGRVSSSSRPVPSCPSVPAPQLHISCSPSSSIDRSLISDQFCNHRKASCRFSLGNLLRLGCSPEDWVWIDVEMKDELNKFSFLWHQRYENYRDCRQL